MPIVLLDVWGIALITWSAGDEDAEGVTVGFDTTVVVVTLFMVLLPLLLLLSVPLAPLELVLPPDNDNVECSIIVLKRLILKNTNHATLS